MYQLHNMLFVNKIKKLRKREVLVDPIWTIETYWLDVQGVQTMCIEEIWSNGYYTSDKCYRKIIIFKYYTAFAYRDPYGAIYKAVLFLLKPKHSFWLAPAPPFLIQFSHKYVRISYEISLFSLHFFSPYWVCPSNCLARLRSPPVGLDPPVFPHYWWSPPNLCFSSLLMISS